MYSILTLSQFMNQWILQNQARLFRNKLEFRDIMGYPWTNPSISYYWLHATTSYKIAVGSEVNIPISEYR